MTKGCGNDKKVCHPGGKHHDGKSFCVNVGVKKYNIEKIKYQIVCQKKFFIDFRFFCLCNYVLFFYDKHKRGKESGKNI